MNATAPRGLFVALALAAVYVVWGSTYLGILFALDGYPPLLMAGLRFLAAGAVLFAVLRLRGVPAPTRAQWRTLLVMGICLLLLGNGLVCVAEQDVSSGLAAVAVASVPLWIGLFSAMRGMRPSRGEWFGLAIGFLGVLWLNAGSSLAATPRGMIALLIAPIAWAFGSVWSRGRDLPQPFMAAAGQMLAGGAVLLVLALALGERIVGVPPLKATAALVYLAAFGSILAFSAYIWLLHNVRPALAGSYAYVNPVIAVALGAAFAGERFGMHDLAAMAVILAGVVAISLARGRARG
ncbi:drug/metabolite exporter YedA [Coralloluteibacterium thermophilus]|uniref:Drug/metabolite exporter YedA n=1 Tax=Coralloluteibacterium thermophilum TaxID=2707049 RepID=A0ABV9NH85_9GAMM